MSKASFINTLSLPVIAAPMFLISGPDLVTECCKNGIVGTFPALNQRSSKGFEQWLIEVKQRLNSHEQKTGLKPAPFGVNLITHRTNHRLQEDLSLCIEHRVPLVITSLGIIPDVVDAIHQYGGLVFHDVINRRHAEKAAKANVDGLILVSAGAGGHGGTINPIAFMSEIKSFFDKTILLSGCISKGRDIASALQMGADMAYIGTRFINTQESLAPQEYRNMIIEAGASDIIYTASISGVNANFLRQSLEAIGITKEAWEQKEKINFEEKAGEAAAWKTIWSAGQGVSSITNILPTSELIQHLKQDFREAINQQYQLLKIFT